MVRLQPFDRCDDLSVSAGAVREGDVLQFSYEVGGSTRDVVFPPRSSPVRTDGLWKATCFEAFISIGETGYVELNFAPSGKWAGYRFANYREGMCELDIASPKIAFFDNRLVATVEFGPKPGSALNLTAVIENRNGVRSYWALAHPDAGCPDFHARDCFVARLP